MTKSVGIETPQARSLGLAAGPESRRMLLGGPPQTGGMRSGVVVLAPGASVGRHTTGAREEVIVVLEGRGEVRVEGRASLAVDAGTAAYVPPATVHDVANTADAPFRYVYVVAPVTVAGAR